MNIRLKRSRLLVLLPAAAGAAAFFLLRPSPPAAPTGLPEVLLGKDPGVIALVEEVLAEIAADPRNPELRMRLGYAYEANFLDSLALLSYEQALASGAARARWWYRLARVKTRLGDRSGAVAAAERAAALRPDYAPLHWRLGFWYLDQGQLERARESFDRADALDPGAAPGHWGLARVMLQSRRPGRAAAILEALLEQRPDDAYARLLLGTAYRQMGRLEEARVELERGAGASPKWRDGWDEEMDSYRQGLVVELGKATRLADEGRPDAAIAIMEELCRKYPQDPRLFDRLGGLYIETQRYKQALSTFEEGLSHHPGNAWFHLKSGALQAEMGNYAEALGSLDRAVVLDSTLSAAHQRRGRVLMETRRYPEAADAFARALDHDPRNATLHLELGLARYELGQFAAGLGNLRRAVELDSTRARAFVALGLTQARLGAFDGAERSLRRAAALEPHFPRLGVYLDEVREMRSQGGDP